MGSRWHIRCSVCNELLELHEHMNVSRIAIWIITRLIIPFVEVEGNDAMFFSVELCSEVLFMQDCDYRRTVY